MKKLSVIAIIVALVLCFSVVAFADITVTVGDVTVEKGTEFVEVPLVLSNNTGLLGLSFTLSYPDDGLLHEGGVAGTTLQSLDLQLSQNLNPIRFIYAGLSADDVTNGTLYTVTFAIKDTNAIAEYDIIGKYELAYNATNPDEDIPVTFIPGKISVVEPAETVTPVGVSLLLDGSIGVKYNVEYDAELVDTIALKASIANSDDSTNTPKTVDFTLNDDGTAYAVVYVPAKDIDNVTITATAEATLKAGGTATTDFGNVTVPQYIKKLEELAKTDATYATALDVVHAMETYCAYADNYFNKGSLASIELTDAEKSAINELTEPGKTEGDITSLKFYASSLILEGRVTLRHYFKINGQDFNPEEYTVTGGTALQYAEGTTNYVYTDIENLSPSELSEQKTVTVARGDKNIKIYFSALNYAALVINDEEEDNEWLIDLAKALYRYSVKADAYAKPIEPGDNEIGNQEW